MPGTAGTATGMAGTAGTAGSRGLGTAAGTAGPAGTAGSRGLGTEGLIPGMDRQGIVETGEDLGSETFCTGIIFGPKWTS